MQIFEVRISHGARVDMAELRKFLKAMMTVEGAIRYANNMREEIKMLALMVTRTCPLSPCVSIRQIPKMNETEKEHLIQLGKQAKEVVKPIIEQQLIKDGINIE